MITGISKVVVPVDDQERATEFWMTQVAFELRRDESYGDQRWIEVGPPDGGPLLVLSPRAADEPRRGGCRPAAPLAGVLQLPGHRDDLLRAARAGR
jgi:hypothetical protein